MDAVTHENRSVYAYAIYYEAGNMSGAERGNDESNKEYQIL